MTLDTRFYVLDPVDPEELFRFGQTLMAEFDDHGRAPEAQIWSDKPKQAWLGPAAGWADDPTGRRRIANRLGQDLPAIWEVEYRPGQMVTTAEESAEHDEDDCEDDCDGTGYAHQTPCWVKGSLDTGYGYRSHGLNCADLHSVLLVRIAAWLHDRGARMGWINEYTGEYHLGLDGLETLSAAGFEADRWFHTEVVPAMQHMTGGTRPQIEGN